MAERRALSRKTGDFLLALLEQPRPAIAGCAMADLDPDIGGELRANGSLRTVSGSASLQVADDNGMSFRDLHWAPDLEQHVYFDAADGWVAPEADDLRLYRFDTRWWLAWLTSELALENAGQPTELVVGHAWDLGDIRVSRKRKAPLLFARRLYAEDVRTALVTSLDRRSGRGGGLLLTTTRRTTEAALPSPSHGLMAVAESLTASEAEFRLDAALIRGLFLGRIDPAGAPALDLSPDGMTLSVHGEMLHFRGDVQRSIIRQLVGGFRAGKRLRTLEVLTKAGSSADSLAKAFKGSHNWPTLRGHLRQEHGFCWFEL